jgi:hypothetical protein
VLVTIFGQRALKEFGLFHVAFASLETPIDSLE